MPYKDPAKNAAAKLAYYQAHKDEIIQKLQEARRADPAGTKQKRAVSYDAHREEIQEKDRARYPARKAERAAYIKDYRKKNPEKIKAIKAATRARRRGAAITDFTEQQWALMQLMYEHRCAYCGKSCKGKLTKDHIIALSKGGDHTWSNIVPACRSCNSKKHTGPPRMPVQLLLLIPK